MSPPETDAATRFPVPNFDELPEDLRDRIEDETDRAGFTPNVFSTLAYKPSHFRAFFAFHDALVEDAALETLREAGFSEDYLGHRRGHRLLRPEQSARDVRGYASERGVLHARSGVIS